MPQAATRRPVHLEVSGHSLVAATYLSGQPRHMLGAWGAGGGYAFRIWRIWAALGLLRPYNNGVTRSAEYRELDSTEMSHLNYVLGGTLAKAYAEKKLDVPWLAHLSVAIRAGYAIDFYTSSRPDYIGYTSTGRDLVIAEAKGRQRVDSRLKAALDGKVQAGAVRHVNRATPVSRYGILAQARMGYPVSIYAVDPPEEVKVDFSPVQWMRAYYSFVRDLAEECANDPQPDQHFEGDQRRVRDAWEWASVDLRVPAAITEWLDNERDLDAWPAVAARARAEAEELGRPQQVTVMSDLLILTSTVNV